MPKSGKKQETPSFEEAISQLEELVSKMEAGELPLEEVLSDYEKGMKLVGFCGEKLKAAEEKIELLTRDKSGNLSRSLLEEQPEPSMDGSMDEGDEEESDPETSLF